MNAYITMLGRESPDATLDQLMEPIRHSPLLPRIVEELQLQIAKEQQLRTRFYEEMTPEQKVEFIDGEVIF